MKKLVLTLAFVVMLALAATSALADQITISVNLHGSAIFTDTSSGITFNFTGNPSACGHNDCLSGHAYLEPAGTQVAYTMWLTGAPLLLTSNTVPGNYSVTTTAPTQLNLEVKLGSSNDLVAAVVLGDVDASNLNPHFNGSATAIVSTGIFASIFPLGEPGEFNMTLDANAVLSSLNLGKSTLASVSDGEFRSPTPEPGTLVLMGSGVLGLAGILRRKIM